MRPHVLLLEDEAPLRRLLGELLAEEGYRVTDGANGLLALRDDVLASVDLVITDILMPACDGIEVLRHVKRTRPEVKVVAISGGSGRMQRDFLPAADMFGAARVVQKPFSPGELIAIVRELAPLPLQGR